MDVATDGDKGQPLLVAEEDRISPFCLAEAAKNLSSRSKEDPVSFHNSEKKDQSNEGESLHPVIASTDISSHVQRITAQWVGGRT